MKNISEDTLRKMIGAVIEKIPRHYRCYELMRKLKEAFHQEGIRLKIRDGNVLYCPMTLLHEASKGNCKLIISASTEYAKILSASKLAAKRAEGKSLEEAMDWKINVLHSWGILLKEKYLIDCHASIDLSLFPGLPLFNEFPVLREITFESLVRVIPFSGFMSSFTKHCMVGNDIFLEIATQKGDTIVYGGTGYSTRLRL